MSFIGITVAQWKEVHDYQFRQSIVNALKQSSSKRKRAVSNLTPDNVIYVSPTPRIVDNNLQVVFFVRDGETTVPIRQLETAVTSQQSEIESKVGAEVVDGTIKAGIPPDLFKDSSSDSNTTLIVIIASSAGGVVVILIVVGALFFVCRRRRSKYNIANTFLDVNYTNAAEIIDDFTDPTAKTTVFKKTEDVLFPDVVPLETFGNGHNRNTHL
jgi:hypothetical protein